MDKDYLILQLLCGLALIGSKYLLVYKNIWGWVVAIIGGFLSLLFCYLINYILIMGLELGFMIICGYGMYKWKRNNENFTIIDSLLYFLSFIIVTTALLYGQITREVCSQYFASIVFITGAVLIGLKKSLGWYFFIIGHATIALLMLLDIEKKYIFFIVQMISIYFAYIGINNFKQITLNTKTR